LQIVGKTIEAEGTFIEHRNGGTKENYIVFTLTDVNHRLT